MQSNLGEFSLKYTERGPKPKPSPIIHHKSLHQSDSQRQSAIKPRYQTINKPMQESKGGVSLSLSQPKHSLPKVPIEYYDQAHNGGGWQGSRGRIVYRGATPKNSLYLIHNAKEAVLPSGESISSTLRAQLEFNSRFECGNLAVASRISKDEYWLYMREDTNSVGLRQWFYFHVGCSRPQRVTFRVYKYARRMPLYNRGMSPYFREAGGEWQQRGTNVKHIYDDDKKCFSLHFQYEFTRQGQWVEVATMPVYSYSTLNTFIQRSKKSTSMSVQMIGQSLGGLDIPLLNIPAQQNQQKPVIVILGRTHPAETCSSFTLQSFITHLQDYTLLCKTFDFQIIPMVNPDGVVAGNHRTSLTGVDLNRKFTASRMEIEMYPEVKAVRKTISTLCKTRKVEFVLDFHGHSGRSNIFAFGQRQSLESEHFFKSRALPKILDEIFPPFWMDYCLFRKVRAKQGTARVWCSQRWGLTCLTFEQSYGLVDQGKIGVEVWRQFGVACLQALTQFVVRLMGQQEQLKMYLKVEYQKEMQRRERNQTKRSLATVRTVKQNEMQNKEEKYTVKEQVQQQQKSDTQSEHSSLDSAEQELQNTPQNIKQLQSLLFPTYQPRISSQRTSPPRQYMSIPDAQLFLERDKKQKMSPTREEKMPIISRILHMKEKKKHRMALVDMLTSKSQRREKDIKEAVLRLPNIRDSYK